MQLRKILAVSFVALLAATKPLGALSVVTAADEVTVFPKGAQVLRAGKADLPAGAQTILFEGLPLNLNEESLRLKVEGPKGCTVFGLKLREAFSDKEQARRREELQQKIQDIEDEKQDLADRISSRKAEADILKALAEKRAGSAGGESGAKVSELAISVANVGKRLELLAKASRKDEREQRDLDKELGVLKAQLQQEGPSETGSRVAEAELELAEAGACRFELVYFVDEASWTPRYDLRLRASEKEPKVELDFLAEVNQTSGENWNDVSLKLSTARPTMDSQVPDPTQWWLDFQMEQTYFKADKRSRGGMAAPQMAPSALSIQSSDYAEKPMLKAKEAVAEVEDLGPATLFSIKRRASIPSMDQGQRVTISKSEHPAELFLVVVPRLSPSAYLEAKILYSSEQPLLPGPAQLFRDGDLAGQVQLPSTAPGESFNLGFGMDERVKASRKRRVQKQGNSGFLGSKNRRSYDWDIKISNFHDGPRDIEVREQLPRSRQDAIKVSALELDPKPAAEDPARPGLMLWSLKLKKGEEKTLRLRYEVSWPEGQKVGGLE